MTRREKNKRARFHNIQRTMRMEQKGWTRRAVWVHHKWMEQIKLFARQYDMTQRAIMCAVLEVGLRHLRPSDIVSADQRYLEMSGMAMWQMLKKGIRRAVRDPITGRILGTEPTPKQMDA